MGVFAFPNKEGDHSCQFIDTDYNKLFKIPDGENIVLTALDGKETVLPCRYIDDCHVSVGQYAMHIFEFAEMQENRGAVYRPEHPKDGDCCDTYTVYQLKSTRETPYECMPLEAAKSMLHPSHYQMVYRGVLAPKTGLDDLLMKHNRDNRPMSRQIRAMSISDVIVLNRNGSEKAFYVDRYAFLGSDDFLHPPSRAKLRKHTKER